MCCSVISPAISVIFQPALGRQVNDHELPHQPIAPARQHVGEQQTPKRGRKLAQHIAQ